MKILNETDKKICSMDINIDDEEYQIYIDYYDDNISQKDKNNLKVEWSIIDILTKIVNENKGD